MASDELRCGMTHWESCWQDPKHHECARARIADLEAQLSEAREDGRRLRTILANTRPIVANAAADPAASPWQTEIRSAVLAAIDAAAGQEGE